MGFFFFSFSLPEGEAVEKALSEHADIIVFAHMQRKAPDDSPMCEIVGSFDTAGQAVSFILKASREFTLREGELFAYTKREVIEGLRTSKRERSAGYN